VKKRVQRAAEINWFCHGSPREKGHWEPMEPPEVNNIDPEIGIREIFSVWLLRPNFLPFNIGVPLK
jgi:hypothetical protein